MPDEAKETSGVTDVLEGVGERLDDIAAGEAGMPEDLPDDAGVPTELPPEEADIPIEMAAESAEWLGLGGGETRNQNGDAGRLGRVAGSGGVLPRDRSRLNRLRTHPVRHSLGAATGLYSFGSKPSGRARRAPRRYFGAFCQ